MMQSLGLVSYLPKGTIKYVLQGTCIGSTDGMKTYLITPWGTIQ
jgi:hypothetical protein